jgi:hypothetical protein
MNEQGNALRVVSHDEMVKVGTHAISVSGFKLALAIEHLMYHLETKPNQPSYPKWCSVGCMARTMFGRDTASNRARIRDRMHKIFKTMLAQGKFLAVEYCEKTGKGAKIGQIVACKIYEQASPQEAQYAARQIERMRRRRQLNEELLARANQLIGIGVAP